MKWAVWNIESFIIIILCCHFSKEVFYRYKEIILVRMHPETYRVSKQLLYDYYYFLSTLYLYTQLDLFTHLSIN